MITIRVFTHLKFTRVLNFKVKVTFSEFLSVGGKSRHLIPLLLYLSHEGLEDVLFRDSQSTRMS